jgi:hypothetical protein
MQNYEANARKVISREIQALSRLRELEQKARIEEEIRRQSPLYKKAPSASELAAIRRELEEI